MNKNLFQLAQQYGRFSFGQCPETGGCVVTMTGPLTGTVTPGRGGNLEDALRAARRAEQSVMINEMAQSLANTGMERKAALRLAFKIMDPARGSRDAAVVEALEMVGVYLGGSTRESPMRLPWSPGRVVQVRS